ncbi:right-handed parallel beta-helix repeat-containing protein [Acanthopleuribacter pedis]|uniref:Right-handed parallel beta-helix repeat-containing protein n=1 Tax=Acanthopleuribacter pedis TaxID=442870 RepID=A0A8J7U5Z6_9BACT|nr:right-handed parallel beta-helix repeat-containing protein [Acanthopleuribacter pedis]MBO1320998.1 right-handed parallel beta-helix repeat-containing protein [Acanthopleuribacter pedis]
MRVLLWVFFGCFLTVLPSYAQIDFRDYYADTTGRVDCTQALIQALMDAKNGEIIEMPEGTFLIQDFDLRGSGSNIRSVKIKGAGKGRTVILTDKFYPRDVADVSLESLAFKGINNTDVDGEIQGTALVAIANSSKFVMKGCEINGSAEDLISVFHVPQVTMTHNGFFKSGLAGRMESDGIRVRGWAVALGAVTGTIQTNHMLEIARGGIFLGSASNGLHIEDNTIDLYLGSDTPRADGLTIGNSGIYIGQEASSIKNVVVHDNRIYNTNINGLRINGLNATVTDNIFTNNGTTAIKAHVLEGATIARNTIREVREGIRFVSQGLISGVTVNDNKLYNTETGIGASVDGKGGSFDSIHILNNTIMGSKVTGVLLWGESDSPTHGNSVQGNTISNGNPNNPTTNPLYTAKPFIWGGIVLFHTNGTYVDNNWIFGQLMETPTTTLHGKLFWRQNHVYAGGGKDGRITRTSVYSPTCVDSDFGGVTLRDTREWHVDRMNFTNITTPVTQINGVDNRICSGTFTPTTTDCYE